MKQYQVLQPMRHEGKVLRPTDPPTIITLSNSSPVLLFLLADGVLKPVEENSPTPPTDTGSQNDPVSNEDVVITEQQILDAQDSHKLLEQKLDDKKDEFSKKNEGTAIFEKVKKQVENLEIKVQESAANLADLEQGYNEQIRQENS